MDVKISQLRKEDFNSAREFAIKGMNFDSYTSNSFELYFYSKYFWYLEVLRATRALGAYMGDKLVGVLLVDIDNDSKVFNSFWYKVFVKIVSFFIKNGYKNMTNNYDNANKEMLAEYRKSNAPDGELIFFAVDPNIKGKGIGSLLLSELEKLEKGKQLYLFTDSGCTYQFYTHRGFDEVGRKDILLERKNKEVSLTCLIFSKRFTSS